MDGTTRIEDGESDDAADRSVVLQFRESASSTLEEISDRTPDRVASTPYREVAERRVDALPVTEGFVVGAGAFVFSYVLTVVTTASAHAGSESGETPGVLTAAAWSFLGNLGVGIEQGGNVPFGVDVSSMAFFHPVMALVTVAVAAAAGYLLVRYTGADNVGSAVRTSVLIATGYVVCAPILALLASWSPQTGPPVSVAVTDAVLYVGVFVPVAFGIVGGLAAIWPEPIDRAVDLIDRVVARITG